MLPPLFLGPKVGESVLDMAAAPGRKDDPDGGDDGNQAQITPRDNALKNDYAYRCKGRVHLALYGCNCGDAGRIEQE